MRPRPRRVPLPDPPPPPGPSGRGEANKDAKGAQTLQTCRKGEENPTDKIQEEAENRGYGSETCHVGEELFACFHDFQNASIGLFLIVQNKGQGYTSVDVEPSINIYVDKKLKVPQGGSKKAYESIMWIMSSYNATLGPVHFLELAFSILIGSPCMRA